MARKSLLLFLQTGLQQGEDAKELRTGAEMIRASTMQPMKMCGAVKQPIQVLPPSQPPTRVENHRNLFPIFRPSIWTLVSLDPWPFRVGDDLPFNRGRVNQLLVDPPGISYFSVNCPGLKYEYQAWLLCAEAAFVLFALTLGSSHFVYTAHGSAGKQPSLWLVPQPRPTFFAWQKLGILTCDREQDILLGMSVFRGWTVNTVTARDREISLGTQNADREHYAVAFLDRNSTTEDDVWRHDFTRQITAEASSLGWVDIKHGILLLRNMFDWHPVIDLISFPVPNVGFPGEDGSYYCAPEYFCDVASCDVASCDVGLIKFVEIKRGDENFLTRGKGWRATVWNMRLSWDGWQKRCTVHVDDISIDHSYSALLPELLDDGTQELELKKLIFYGPILSVHDDDLLYMMTKVNAEDDDGWPSLST
uniref:Uncharacterized protein n=1 Tax=Aegilops tauschii TaxID=37682 RepID=R7WFE5_AEGTA